MDAFQSKEAFIWSIADLLRGDCKQSEYGRVILPFAVSGGLASGAKIGSRLRQLVAIVVVSAMVTGCFSRHELKPDGLVGFETEKEKTVIVPYHRGGPQYGGTGNFSILGFEQQTFYFQTADGRIVKVEGEPSVTITTKSGSEEYEYPIRIEMEEDRFRIYSGNLAPADYEKSDVTSVVLSEYHAIATRLTIGLVIGVVVTGGIALFAFGR